MFVRPVLSNPPRVPHEGLPRLGLAVSVQVGEPEEVGTPVVGIGAVRIERGAVEEDPLAVLDPVAHDLLGFEEAVPVVVEQPNGMAALLGDDRPSLGVERHLDQGTDLVGVGDGFHDETRRDAVRAVEHGICELTADGNEDRRNAGNDSHECGRF